MTATSLPSAPTVPRKKELRDRRVILLEFNELSPTLIDGFIKQGELPNFRRFRDESRVYITDAQEAAPNLEPWIQWVTVHSGLSYDQHGIFHLGDGHQLAAKCLWDLLSDAGYRVWVCGSMNQRYDLPINGMVLPDPWATGLEPHPRELGAFYNFVKQNVQEYTNDSVPLGLADYRDFVVFMLRHGMGFGTMTGIGSQLLRERFNKKSKWRRATILDRLQWDVFRWYFKKTDPHFSTFFINSTAHFQHAHWRNMDPEPFTVKPTDSDQAEYAGTVLYGYQKMDGIVGEALDLASDGRTTLVLASALGQQPCLVYEDIGGKTFYRARTLERLLEFAGVPSPHEVQPVMSEEFHVHFRSEEAAKEGYRLLSGFRVNGKPAMNVQLAKSSVYAGCRIWEKLDKDAVLEHTEAGTSIPFFRLFYQVESLKSGMHHPDGILWIREPGTASRSEPKRVPLVSVAPTVLSMFGLEPSTEMKGSALAD